MVTVIQPLLSDAEMEALILILEYLEEERMDYAHRAPEDRPGHIYESVLVLHASGQFPRSELFELGQFRSTPGAIAAMNRSGQEPSHFLRRHEIGDWGEVSSEDWENNQIALSMGYRVLSSYRTTAKEKLWIITEADRSSTTILLPEEY